MNRVVVTGLGAVTPIGNDVNSTWESMKNGVCGVDYIKNVPWVHRIAVKVAAQLKDFEPLNRLSQKEIRRFDRYCILALYAADEAFKDSKIDLNKIDCDRFGSIISSGVGGLITLEEGCHILNGDGEVKGKPMLIPNMIANMASGLISIKYGAKGESKAIVTACSSSTQGIGETYRMIKHGYLDICMTGGSDATITQLGIAGFTALTALSKCTDPKRSSIPFDKERNGFVMGEGAGVIVLESLESALKRGVRIYAELIGYGATSDAYHITAPDPTGMGAAKSMQMAINDAGISNEDIQYINAHGTSTELNDKVETLAIRNTFKDHAHKLNISSTKSMTGHLLGAAGVIEAIACIQACNNDIIPPTIGYKVKDEECDLNYTVNECVKKRVNYALSNSLGFGGHNGTLIFKKWNNE